jgi:hypothetical protein
MLRAMERGPTHFPSDVFTFEFVVESIKEYEGALVVLLVFSRKTH